MSSGYNSVTLIGNLGQDPEVRYAQSGTAICNLRIAVTERRKDGEEYKDHTEWVNVTTFGKTAENAGQFLGKGRQVCVEGSLRTRTYQAKDGTEKTATEVVANRVIFLGSKNDAAQQSPTERAPTNPGRPAYKGAPNDDDLPFDPRAKKLTTTHRGDANGY